MNLYSFLKILIQNGDFGNGFLVLSCFSPVFNVFCLFFMFSFGLKLLHFTKKTSSNPSSFNFLEDSRFKNKGNSDNQIYDSDECDQSEIGAEDEEYDVLKLRKLVKIERLRANKANVELEKERMASATAAEEAMSMILRLQNEKSSLEIEANHYRRIAEQKLEYDREIIQALQWIVMKYEPDEMCVLEEELEFCKMELEQDLKSSEFDQIDESLNLVEPDIDDLREDSSIL